MPRDRELVHIRRELPDPDPAEHLYSAWMRRLFGYVVPLAFVNYFPALYILGKADPLHAPPIVRLLSPVAAGVMVALAWVVWRLAVRHYRSSGS